MNLQLNAELKNVAFELFSSSDAAQIYSLVQSEDNNMDVVRLEKAPKIAVYVPPDFNPGMMLLRWCFEYAKVPYDKIWNDEILRGDPAKI